MGDEVAEALVVAIDGPAGAGKSTAAKGVARALGYVLVDTGALYRAVALAALEAGIASLRTHFGRSAREGARRARARLRGSRGTRRASAGVARRARARRRDSHAGGVDGGEHGQRATRAFARRCSTCSARSGRDGGVVLEGRDIGTVVFPDAEAKVFLTASPERRARRRFEELTARGEPVEYERVLDDVIARDKQDSERAVAPLRAADDAVALDATEPVEEVIAGIVARVRGRRAALIAPGFLRHSRALGALTALSAVRPPARSRARSTVASITRTQPTSRSVRHRACRRLEHAEPLTRPQRAAP